MKKRLPSAIGSSILEHVSLNDQMHVMDLLIRIRFLKTDQRKNKRMK
jgi:hypothetical protein